MSPSRPRVESFVDERGVPIDPYEQPEQTFPKLAAEMIDRIRPYGKIDHFDGGSYLFQVGDRNVDFFLILDGAVDILQSDGRGGHVLVVTHEKSEFTGELDHLSGRAVIVCARAARPTDVLRVSPASLRRLSSAEPDIGYLLLRAFILRRVGLIEHADGGTVVVGSGRTADTLRLQSFLTRNGYPLRVLDTDTDPDAASALQLFHLSNEVLPAVVLNAQTVLKNPTNRALADALGITEHLAPDRVYDVTVVGAGPAGLAAAVYSASEGLDTLVVEGLGPGGQAGSSSRIENYLGFPMGISGLSLATRAQVQAEKFGARFAIARPALSLDCSGLPFTIRLTDQVTISTRAVVVATGARYRKLDVPNLERFQGQGVHYAATSVESRLCVGDEVIVVGGGNSAGQAALYLASQARHVHMLIRGDGLAETMSDYLIRRIESSSRISVHTGTRVTSLHGNKYLEAVGWRERDGAETIHPTANLFLMIGALPNTDWLSGCVALDAKGFIITGRHANGQFAGSPYVTSVPGIYAVGDVRSDSIKRVAASVGEGSVVVHDIHQWLASASVSKAGESTRPRALVPR
jgi:thioredoxin reductase (NADPH)